MENLEEEEEAPPPEPPVEELHKWVIWKAEDNQDPCLVEGVISSTSECQTAKS